MENAFRGSKSHTVLWGQITRTLTDMGMTFTRGQCLNKFKLLKRQWKACVDHNSKTGNDRKTSPFMEDFGRVYGTRAGTQPAYTMASTSKVSTNSIVTVDTRPTQKDNVEINNNNTMKDRPPKNDKVRDEQCPADVAKNTADKVGGKMRPIPRVNARSATTSWMQGYEARLNARREETEEKKQKRHEDKMALLDRLVDVIAKK